MSVHYGRNRVRGCCLGSLFESPTHRPDPLRVVGGPLRAVTLLLRRQCHRGGVPSLRGVPVVLTQSLRLTGCLPGKEPLGVHRRVSPESTHIKQVMVGSRQCRRDRSLKSLDKTDTNDSQWNSCRVRTGPRVLEQTGQTGRPESFPAVVLVVDPARPLHSPPPGSEVITE